MPDVNPLTLPPAVMAGLWKVSPAAMARYLTRNNLPSARWIPARHLTLLSQKIVEVVSGRTPRLIVNMPPRHGKSEEISKWAPVWFLENWPYKHVIDVGFNVTFAEEWGRKVRNLAGEYKDQLTFRLSPDSKSAGRWNTTQGGGMFSTGIDGQITGRGADLLIIDDPHKDAKEANSLVARDAVWSWWQDTANSRVMPGGAVIVVMTRWHDDDFAGRLLKAAARGEGEQWEVLNLPAIAEEGVADPLGRAPGEALWPEERSLEYLHGKQLVMTEEAWQAQFQGTPGNLAKIGNVYKAYNRLRNVRPRAFDPRRPLVWSLDFNVDPMCSAIAQWHDDPDAYTFLTNRKKQTISVLQELCLPNSSTLEACEEFVNRTQKYVKEMNGRPLHVRIYGDRSGQSRKTVGDSDYVAIMDFFRTRGGQYSVTKHLSKANPGVKDRVNAVNAMLCNAAGEVRTLIDPSCEQLIEDFKQIQWKRDSSGNTTGAIDKSDQNRTHISDAYGYFVTKEFGLKSAVGVQPGIMQ